MNKHVELRNLHWPQWGLEAVTAAKTCLHDPLVFCFEGLLLPVPKGLCLLECSCRHFSLRKGLVITFLPLIWLHFQLSGEKRRSEFLIKDQWPNELGMTDKNIRLFGILVKKKQIVKYLADYSLLSQSSQKKIREIYTAYIYVYICFRFLKETDLF